MADRSQRGLPIFGSFTKKPAPGWLDPPGAGREALTTRFNYSVKNVRKLSWVIRRVTT